ncbi:hypothetical protein [Desulfolithobacter sp.]
MITLPADFDVAMLVNDFFALAAPFVSLSFLVACGFLINNILRRV